MTIIGFSLTDGGAGSDNATTILTFKPAAGGGGATTLYAGALPLMGVA